jgi:hypothetical protein
MVAFTCLTVGWVEVCGTGRFRDFETKSSIVREHIGSVTFSTFGVGFVLDALVDDMVTLHALVIFQEVRGNASLALICVRELLTIGDSFWDLVTRISGLVQIVPSFTSMAFIKEVFVDVTVVDFSDWSAFVKVVDNVESVEHFGSTSDTGISFRMEGSTVLGSVLDAVASHVEVAW